MTAGARYDGLADWYDAEIGRLPITATAIDTMGKLLGSGSGRCLDLACGTGVAMPIIAALGWRVFGVDVSDDQLRIARLRAAKLPAEILAADAASLPFDDASFEAVVSIFTHTDFDRPDAVIREVARVLRPGGRFIYVGTHPCFVSPYVERRAEEPHRLHPGYRRRGWTMAGPGFGHGIRPRVGVNHFPLTDLLQMIIDGGLRLTRIEEPGEDDYPLLIALVAER